MMNPESSSFPSIVEMTTFKFMKSVIRTPEELVVNSWRERSTTIQSTEITILKRIS
jgi:hypothetical protein